MLRYIDFFHVSCRETPCRGGGAAKMRGEKEAILYCGLFKPQADVESWQLGFHAEKKKRTKSKSDDIVFASHITIPLLPATTAVAKLIWPSAIDQ